MKNMVAEDYT